MPAHETVFGQYIRRVRKDKYLTQEIVATRADVPQELLSKWELGKLKRPSTENVKALAQALGVPVVNLALALLDIEPEAYIFPELEKRPLLPEMRSILNANPSPAETRIVLDLLQTLRREMLRAVEEEEEKIA
jgi:transcriptional regulator with XRE-family HTH domain